MNSHHSNEPTGNLEDEIRRMILLGPSVPHKDTSPESRLPHVRQHSQQPVSGMHSFNQAQAQAPPQPPPQWRHSHSIPSASRQHNHFPPSRTTPLVFSAQAPQPYHVTPPHMRQPQYKQSAGSYGPPLQPLPPAHAPYPSQAARDGGESLRGHPAQRLRYSHHQPGLDPDAFERGEVSSTHGRPPAQSRDLYNPNPRLRPMHAGWREQRERQAQYLEQIARSEVPNMEMSPAEYAEKEAFQHDLQKLCLEVCSESAKLPKVSLECFGSFRSGFASAGSDMDLVIVIHDQSLSSVAFSLMEDDLPRELERKLLRKGHGARLLTRTRVPIIKVCEKPSESLLDKLRAERERWDFLPNEQKYPHLHPDGTGDEGGDSAPVAERTRSHDTDGPGDGTVSLTGTATVGDKTTPGNSPSNVTAVADAIVPATENLAQQDAVSEVNGPLHATNRQHQTKTWTRERKPGPLDFPKHGIGIQCDINFFNPLGLHNTHMLRCYSLCDSRVRPIVLFVKSWAKSRKINSSYSGTLSSYGYVLMVLHYLMNVVEPPVIPNLQHDWRPNRDCTPAGANAAEVDGWLVDFWRNENEIVMAVESGQMSANREPVGSLLVGFFQYFASQGQGPKFHWMNEVLSLRSPRGLLSKIEKGWVKATTEEGEGKKIQNRYLLCIEDPFELSHNVARTVTHNGIVAIRDEFRRANRILQAVGWGNEPNDGELLANGDDTEGIQAATAKLKLTAAVRDGEHNGPESRNELDQQRMPVRPPHLNPANSDGSAGRPQALKAKAKVLDITDQETFPSLSAGGKKKSKSKKNSINHMDGDGSISGEKAAAYLEQFRRNKAEQEAEHTAMGAAEAVLNED